MVPSFWRLHLLCQKDLNTAEAMGYFFVAVAGIDLAIPDPVAGLFVKLNLEGCASLNASLFGSKRDRKIVALISAVSVVAFMHMASAADLYRPAYKAPPPPPPPVQDWSGIYVGV